MEKKFKIYSICIIKNEDDIIEHCLNEALKWSDKIFVYDNKSTDNTWDKVVALSKKNKKVIPWKQDDKPFRESLRAEAFNEFRHLANEGDWWCRLDADEFYVKDPKSFLADVNLRYSVVYGVAIEYYLTNKDLEILNFTDRIEKILSQIRYYKIENSEPRFFRYRNKLTWKIDEAWPRHMGIIYPKAILYRHYKYRSSLQIQLRIDKYQDTRKRGYVGGEHYVKGTWRDKIADTKNLLYDNNKSVFEVPQNVAKLYKEKPQSFIIKYVMSRLGIWP